MNSEKIEWLSCITSQDSNGYLEQLRQAVLGSMGADYASLFPTVVGNELWVSWTTVHHQKMVTLIIFSTSAIEEFNRAVDVGGEELGQCRKDIQKFLESLAHSGDWSQDCEWEITFSVDKKWGYDWWF